MKKIMLYAALALAMSALTLTAGWLLYGQPQAAPSASVSAPAAPARAKGDPTNCVTYVRNWRAGGRPADDGFGARYLQLTEDADRGVAMGAEEAARQMMDHIVAGTLSGPAAVADGASVFYLCRGAYPAETK